MLDWEDETAVAAALRRVLATLPAGGSLDFHFAEANEDGWDGLVLDMLSLPQDARGTGTGIMARVLAAADRRGMEVRLSAEATERPGDPGLFELARWYSRLGFSMDGLSARGGLAMRRLPLQGDGSEEAVLQAYDEARLRGDLQEEAFAGTVGAFVRIFGDAYGEEWRRQARRHLLGTPLEP